MREKLDFNLLLYFVMGITPACAGKANVMTIAKPETGDHPRVCGKSILPIVLAL